MPITAYWFDKHLSLHSVLPEPAEWVHVEHDFQLTGSFPMMEEAPDAGDVLGFHDIDGRFRLFELDAVQRVLPDNRLSFTATDLAVRELSDNILSDLRPTGVQAGAAVMQLLSGTPWALGAAPTTGIASVRVYYQTAWSALRIVCDAYHIEVIAHYQFDHNRIAARKVDILLRHGTQRGRVFTIDRDIERISMTVDTSCLKTALYGRGRGIEIEHEEKDGTDNAYGRRLNFADVVWNKARGDPCDKPLGQEWVGDEAACTLWGRENQHRFDVAIFEDITDPETLLQKTWAQLQSQSTPMVTISATVQDMEQLWGYSHDAVRLGDDVTLRIPEWGADIMARVVELYRDYAYPERTRLTIGDARQTTGGMLRSLTSQVDNHSSRSGVWDRADAFTKEGNLPTDHLQGEINLLNNRLLSTTSNWYTDPVDGSLIFLSSDGNSAMRLSGAGWQIANHKIGEVWQWRTAADGSGIVADQVTSGVLQANLVKILGTDRFYWDAQCIYIIDPDNARQQIRIGMYDGVRYGIGYTKDGGATWQSAIGFDGITLSTSMEQQVYGLVGLRMQIVSSMGGVLTSGIPSTTLTARIWNGNRDITDTLSAASFVWTRTSQDATADSIWNQNHYGVKQVTVSTTDVYYSADFRCELLDA